MDDILLDAYEFIDKLEKEEKEKQELYNTVNKREVLDKLIGLRHEREYIDNENIESLTKLEFNALFEYVKDFALYFGFYEGTPDVDYTMYLKYKDVKFVFKCIFGQGVVKSIEWANSNEWNDELAITIEEIENRKKDVLIDILDLISWGYFKANIEELMLFLKYITENIDNKYVVHKAADILRNIYCIDTIDEDIVYDGKATEEDEIIKDFLDDLGIKIKICEDKELFVIGLVLSILKEYLRHFKRYKLIEKCNDLIEVILF